MVRPLNFAASSPFEGELMDEVVRSSRDYVRWLQAALNRLNAAGLTVDGIAGSRTRSAVVAFQRRKRLTPDGIVGPVTEAALIAAGAGLPPGATAPTRPPAASPAPAPGAPGSGPVVTINTGVVVSANAVRVLKDILRAAGLSKATITSGRRDSSEQARVMFNLIAGHGVSYAKDLYGSSGDQVIDVYAAGKAAGHDDTRIKAAMRDKIVALGPSNVSKHASDDHDVIDVAPSSISNADAFRRALDSALAAGTITHYIPPPGDPAFHIEIRLAATTNELGTSFIQAPPIAREVLLQEAETAAACPDCDFERGRRAPKPTRRGPRPLRPKPGRFPRGGVFVERARIERDALTDASAECALAGSSVERLRTLLASLQAERVRESARPAHQGLLRAALQREAESLEHLLPLFISHGCCGRHLSEVETQLAALSWPVDSALAPVRARLSAALRKAASRASASQQCG